MHVHAQSHHRAASTITIKMFSRAIRGYWLFALAITLISELVPLTAGFEAQFSTLVFHSYEGAKLVVFFLFGALTPLAWWRYQTLGTGVLFAITTTAIVEVGQTFVPGHRTSLVELVVKLVLLFAGFALALDARKYQNVSVGPVLFRFSSPYWT